MASYGKEDQDQRKINGMEDSKTTIEFLRAKLLAERSVSQTARQRADELSHRVSELEEQLKAVSLQRKKAEKATAAVLSILENHGINDASEEFSSGSDQETSLSDSKDAENKREGREISLSVKEKEDDADTFSSSEITSSPSTARSLSWKSDKGSSHYLDRRKYTGSNRRRCNFAPSTGISSSKRVGKSCRRIRRRDTRSASDELQNSSAECASEARPSSSNNGPKSLMDGAGNSDANQVQVTASGVSINGRREDKSDKDMERALNQQAQLIGQYEAEEKAQREWEEKYRESNSYTRDSCDPGNYSDVTEERDDLKASQKPCLAGRTGKQNHANKYGAADIPSTEKNGTTNSSPSTPQVNMGCLEDKKSNRIVKSDSPASEFARPMSNGNYLESHGQTPAYSHRQSFPVTRSAMHPGVCTTSYSGDSSLQAGQGFQRGYELALVSHNTSNVAGSVLWDLEQAKLSLSQQINSSPPLRAGSSTTTMEHSIPSTRIEDRSEIPALLRLPTDFQLEATTTASYQGLASRFSSANYFPEPTTYKFSTSPYVESQSNSITGNRFSTLSPRPYPEVSTSAPSYRPISETTLDTGLPSSVRFNPNSSSHVPFSSKFTYPTYPSCPGVVPNLSSGEVFSRNLPRNETGIPPSFSFSTLCPDVVPKFSSGEAFSRNFPKNERGIPPSFSVSRYDTHIRQNMYSS
ncbi:flocculation protein FLO11-like [Nicotiana tomentosiformis]|uniref:flocculation protein FLO11-like n=1 Tax=Nicotiana tomentosiformis TaxID=4098 RepID=UPI00051B0BF2|nr:uncharacterized protein LOC104099600 [Nicotiana tomentosiformis]